MLIENGDGTYTGGPLDVICLLRDVKTGRFHTCFVEEHPIPGPVKDVSKMTFVRLKSKNHHTAGGATLEEGLKHLEELASKLLLPGENILRTPTDWDGEAFVVITANWRLPGASPLALSLPLPVAPKYEQIGATDVPSAVRFDVPAENQGQIIEIAYGGFGQAEHGPGDLYKRVTARGGPTIYYRRS